MKNDAFSIKIAARQSGLTPFVIRAWERRYDAVEPVRTPSNQRRYTRENIERLTKLRQAVDAGYRIGDIAHMKDEELDNLVASSIRASRNMMPLKLNPDRDDEWVTMEVPVIPVQLDEVKNVDAPTAEEYISKSMGLIYDMNESGLESLLSRSSITMTQPVFLEAVILPLARMVGDEWHSGKIRISQEHMASWVIKAILSGLLRSKRYINSAPRMIVTTPTGQRHEIGALAVAITGAHCGWNITYLGPDLPAEEIAATAIRTQASLVSLSLVYPSDDPLLPDELRRLKHLLPRQIPVIAGGAAAGAYQKVMDSLGIYNLGSLQNLREYLNNYRSLFQEDNTPNQESGNF